MVTSSLLAMLALVTLVIKTFIEWRAGGQLHQPEAP
jgi:ABC-type sulfate transport system permease subunit